MTTILSHQEDLGPSMLDVKYEGLGGTGLVTTPLIIAPNLSECNVSHGGIARMLHALTTMVGVSRNKKIRNEIAFHDYLAKISIMNVPSIICYKIGIILY